MKKYVSLIKATMSEGMNIFKINTKKNNKIFKIIVPIFLAIVIMSSIYFYSETLITQLQTVNMEYVLLTIFILLTSFLTLVEGIYKSGNLLFNCKDDNLLLSLPIKKNTVLLVRILKFYIFELAYNSLFILPAIISYAIHTTPNITYYLVSLIGLLLFPIIPILISCILGSFITYTASKFKGKNTAQTILTFILLIGIMYLSFNTDKLLMNISSNASGINNSITKLYYPAKAYIELVLNFNVIELIKFIVINLLLSGITILLTGKIYFNINTKAKSIKTNQNEKKYTIKTLSPVKSLIKKELNRFINSTVFVTNSAFGLVLHIIWCVLLIVKFDDIANTINMMSININNYISLIMFSIIIFTSFMTSITSSMISLEGKSLNILKILPVKPYTIIKAKIFTALLIMIPIILLGDILVFINFGFDIFSIFLILVASILFPLFSETVGIIVNLKYPRMDAKNDTEIVKQSMSSTICVFIGLVLSALSIYFIFKAMQANIPSNLIMLVSLVIYSIIYIFLSIFLQKTAEKSFENIEI